MNIFYPNMQELTDAQQERLKHLKSVVEKAIADGVLTLQEITQITDVLRKNRSVTPQEMELILTLIREKIIQDELLIDQLIVSF